MIRAIASSIVLILLAASAASGGTYYVRKTGSDSANGQSPATAWQTIGKAAATLVVGDTVYVGAGTYNEQVTENTDGTSANPIQYVADTDGSRTGDAGNVIISSAATATLHVEGDYVVVNGFKITGGTHCLKWEDSVGGRLENCELYGSGDDGIRLEEVTVTISGCTIRNMGEDGIDTQANVNLTLSDSTIRNCPGEGIDANEPTTTLVIQRCRFHDNGAEGIEVENVTASVVNCLIYNNGTEGIWADAGAVLTVWHSTIAYNGDEGIDVQGGSATVRNSIIAFNADDGLAKRSGASLSSSFNLVHGNNDLQYNGLSAGSGDVSTNPQFIGSGDYRVAAGSPAIDAATDGSSVTSVDLDGNARPLDDGWDMGCYEGSVMLLFSDVSAATGFNVQSAADENLASGIYWGDLDNDGDLDAIIGGSSSARKLMNVSAGTSFSVSTFGAGDVRRQGALVDLDNDGDLDFWSASVGSFDTEEYYENDGDGGFTDRGNLGLGDPENNEGLAAADVNGDGWCDIVMFSGDNNWIGHNSGETPVALVGTIESSYGLNDGGDYGNGVFCSSGDVNNDGWLDFFYHHSGGRLFLSDGDGTFTENASGISIVTAGGSSTQKAGSAWADYDNDGDLDLFAARYDAGQTGYLWRNDGGTFSNVTSSAGVTDSSGQRGCCWGDYDSDGDLDLYVVTRAGDANVLYRNNGDGTFTSVNEGAAAAGDGHDCVFVDYDNDGDMDLAVTQEDAGNTLLRNNTDDDQYLKVRVIGGGNGRTNTAAVGVRVDLYAANGTTFLARCEIGTARGYGGTEPMWVHFGGVDPDASYVVKVHFVDAVKFVPVTPSATSTVIGAATIPQMLTVQEQAGKLVLRNWRTRGSTNRGTVIRAARDAPGWTAPVKDVDHVSELDQN